MSTDKTTDVAGKNRESVKDDLISTSAHQLRTSLSAMKWMLKMFLDKDLGDMTDEQEAFIKKAYESNERMIQLVNDMLTLSHTEEASISLKPEPINLTTIIEETVFEFSGESHKKNIDVIFIRPESPIPEVTCDKEMMRVVLQNLVENAIKYSDSGSKVFISAHEKSDMLEISVRDAGIGISKEEATHIFEKFYRADGAKEKDPIGSGLGLFTVKKIMDRHKGRVWFESDRESGTVFSIALPLK